MKRTVWTVIVAALLLAIIITCATVPITGRRQLSLIPRAQITTMSFQEYDQFLSSHKLSTNVENTATVKKVGLNIKRAVEKYFIANNMQSQLNGYEWEFNLVEDSLVNAWCMPGGKVVVYTGLLPVTKTENGLAVVMGHEIAHAIANHGEERMSQGLLTQLGGIALDKALEQKPQETKNLYMTAFGLGAQLGVLLPFSRTHESEADHMGLIFMAMAGYDPKGALEFWQRMAAQSGGANIPQILSTHPSDQTRIDNIKKYMPEALKYYKK